MVIFIRFSSYLTINPKQPEIWMQITVPNEFQPVGKFNIGCTAGIESTFVQQNGLKVLIEWI